MVLLSPSKHQQDYMTKQQFQYGTLNEEGRSHGEGSITSEIESHRPESEYSKTDTYPKTNLLLTTTNIVKSFIGLGILATPYGFSLVGFGLASGIIILNGTLNLYTIHL